MGETRVRDAHGTVCIPTGKRTVGRTEDWTHGVRGAQRATRAHAHRPHDGRVAAGATARRAGGRRRHGGEIGNNDGDGASASTLASSAAKAAKAAIKAAKAVMVGGRMEMVTTQRRPWQWRRRRRRRRRDGVDVASRVVGCRKRFRRRPRWR